MDVSLHDLPEKSYSKKDVFFIIKRCIIYLKRCIRLDLNKLSFFFNYEKK